MICAGELIVFLQSLERKQPESKFIIIPSLLTNKIVIHFVLFLPVFLLTTKTTESIENFYVFIFLLSL